MPAIGVYQYTYGMLQVLYDDLDHYSEADLQFELITGPLVDVVEMVKRGEVDKFTGREMFIRRAEQIDEDYDTWTMNLSFDTVMDDMYELWGECDYCWEVLCDDSDDIRPKDTYKGADIRELAMEATGQNFTILIHTHTSNMYVLRSTHVAMCREYASGSFIGYKTADADLSGGLETYVLPPDMLESARGYDEE